MITGAKDNLNEDNEEKHTSDLTDYNVWLSEPKVSGTNTMQVETYFTFKTEYALKEIIEEDIEILQAENIRFDIKRTRDEHTNRIGFLTGPIIDEVNMPWHDKMLKLEGKLDEGTLEVRKKYVHEGREGSQWSIAVHSVQSEVDNVDYELRKMSSSNKTHTKHVSFKHNTRAERIAGMNLNKMLNGRLKYDWLENVRVFDKATFQGEKKSTSQIIMNAKAKGMHIFNRLEQGRGKYSERLHLHYKPNMKEDAQKWIQQHYGTIFKIEGQDQHVSSVRAISKEDETINSNIQDYISSRLQEVTITTENTRRSCSSVVKGTPKDDETCQHRAVDSDDETCITNNASAYSKDSLDSYDEITTVSNQTEQSQVIIDLQASPKRLENNQQKLLDHMQELEDSIVTLSKGDENSKEMKKARKLAGKLAKKKHEESEQEEEKTE